MRLTLVLCLIVFSLVPRPDSAAQSIPFLNLKRTQGTAPQISGGLDAGVGYWQQKVVLDPAPADDIVNLGQSVSVSNGVVVIGGSLNSQTRIGAALVFLAPRPGSNAKMTEAAKLTASDGQPDDQFGYAVAIDGDTIVVGAPYANQGAGKIYVYVMPPSGWQDMTETAQLTASKGVANDALGFSVSISGDTIVGGAPGVNTATGASYVFVKPDGQWQNATQTSKLWALGGEMYDSFGSAVSISGDVIAVGAPRFRRNRGAAFVFVKKVNGWTNTTQTAGLSAHGEGQVGASVSTNGKIVVAGAPNAAYGDSRPGVAYVYVEPPGGWTGRTSVPNATLSSLYGRMDDQFGTSVSLMGTVILVGAPNANCVGRHCYGPPYEGKGAVYGFFRSPNGWHDETETAELTAHYGLTNSRFGESVAAAGPLVVIGSPQTDNAYAFEYFPNRGFWMFTLPDGTTAFPLGISSTGDIVGSSTEGSFLDVNGVFTAIAYPGAQGTYPRGVNSQAEVVGQYYPDQSHALGFSEQNGIYTSLSVPGALYTYAYGVNDLGDIVGVYSSADYSEAFLYSGGTFSYPSFPGALATLVYGINNSGEMVGSYCLSPCNSTSGFTSSGGIYSTFNYPGAAYTQITAIDNAGDFIGSWSGNEAGQGGEFVYWAQTQELESFNIGGIGVSAPNGINDSGEIVGSVQTRYSEYGFYGHLPGH